VESATQLLPEFYPLSIALLTKFPPDRFKVIYKGHNAFQGFIRLL
jgi:hypothetical protein